VVDAFCPWRSYLVVPPEGLPTAVTFVIDAARVADESWLDQDHVLGYGPMGGQDQVSVLYDLIAAQLHQGKGVVGIESGLATYLPEGNLTQYEYQRLAAALPEARLVNAHDIVDELSLIKDAGTINRFREASRIVDVGHQAVYEAIRDGGYRGMTETEIGGLAAYAMRKAGSEWEWSFTGGNEIASGYRTGLAAGACTPATRRALAPGEPLMVDLHAMFKLGLGDHAHNYLLAPATDRQRWHAQNFVDLVALCLKAIGNRNEAWQRALRYCLENSLDQEAGREVVSQVDRLGHEIHKVLSGLVGAVDKFQAPLVNAYGPDILMRDVLEQNLLLYVQLPSNLFKIQAPSLGKVFLMDIQQEGSMRQVFRATRNQRPFSVVVDEFGRFADLSFVDSINQLRDANLQFTVAHQSLADLELVSREFSNSVWDNTRIKDVLSQDNPALCEMLAKSIGTKQEVMKTVRTEPGPLLTSLATREASTRIVEAYRLHPNRIKNLARCGQGYLYTDSTLHPVCYGQLPPLTASYPLPRRSLDGRGLRLYETFIEKAPVQGFAFERRAS
jgi:methionine aminopeptidase